VGGRKSARGRATAWTRRHSAVRGKGVFLLSSVSCCLFLIFSSSLFVFFSFFIVRIGSGTFQSHRLVGSLARKCAWNKQGSYRKCDFLRRKVCGELMLRAGCPFIRSATTVESREEGGGSLYIFVSLGLSAQYPSSFLYCLLCFSDGEWPTRVGDVIAVSKSPGDIGFDKTNCRQRLLPQSLQTH
jgi:hypothetical protein